METKQVIVVRKDLKMRKGKLAAQVAHASMKVLLDLMTKYINVEDVTEADTFAMPPVYNYSLIFTEGTYLHNWLDGLFTKVVVSVDSEEELFKILNEAEHAMIPCALITDAGLTEFGGVPTNTCIAIGPYLSEDLDAITGHLKLM